MNSIDLLKPGRTFECEFCGESFDASSYLFEHFRIHREEKPQESRYYDNSFSDQSCLTDHMEFDTLNEKQPFESQSNQSSLDENQQFDIDILTEEQHFETQHCEELFNSPRV